MVCVILLPPPEIHLQQCKHHKNINEDGCILGNGLNRKDENEDKAFPCEVSDKNRKLNYGKELKMKTSLII